MEKRRDYANRRGKRENTKRRYWKKVEQAMRGRGDRRGKKERDCSGEEEEKGWRRGVRAQDARQNSEEDTFIASEGKCQ